MRHTKIPVRILALSVILSVGFGCCVSGPFFAVTIPEAERERRAAEARQEAAERDMELLEQGKKDSAREADALDLELTALLTDMELLEEDINGLREQIGDADKVYRQTKADQDRRYAMLKKRIQFLYEEGEITYLDILLRSKNIGDVINGTEYFQQLYEYDKNMILDYEDIKKETMQQKEALEEKQSELIAMEQEQRQHKTALETAVAGKREETADFDRRLSEAEQEAQLWARTAREKTEQIRVLQEQAEQRRRQEAERLAAERRAAGTAGPDISGPAIARVPIKSTGGSQFGRQVADYALQFVGNPYVWGGTSLTGGADCSGFTQSVYKHFGVNIPRTSGEQAYYGREIAYEDMEPGDLICYPGHVSMYIGDGKIVHARSTKAGIRVDDDPAYRTIVSIRRPWQ